MNVRHISASLDTTHSESRHNGSYPAINDFWRREEKKSLRVTFSERHEKLSDSGRQVPRAPGCE